MEQRGILLQNVFMLCWKCWLPQGGGSCAEVSCIHTLHFPNWLEVFPGGEMLPRAGIAAMKHSEHHAAPYVSHIVDEEVEALTHLVNTLLVQQRPNVGSRSQDAQCRALVHGDKMVYAVWGCRKGEQHIQRQA